MDKLEEKTQKSGEKFCPHGSPLWKIATNNFLWKTMVKKSHKLSLKLIYGQMIFSRKWLSKIAAFVKNGPKKATWQRRPFALKNFQIWFTRFKSINPWHFKLNSTEKSGESAQIRFLINWSYPSAFGVDDIELLIK